MKKKNAFPSAARVRHQRDFDRVYAADAFAADPVLVVKACRNRLTRSRLGLSVSRAVGNAVMRNRWKRTIREAFRTRQSALPVGLDLVVRPKKGATPDFAAIQKSLVKLVERLARQLPQERT